MDLFTLPERRATPCYIDSFQLQFELQEGTVSYSSTSFETLHLRPFRGGTFVLICIYSIFYDLWRCRPPDFESSRSLHLQDQIYLGPI